MGSNERGSCSKKEDICGQNEQYNSAALFKKGTYSL